MTVSFVIIDDIYEKAWFNFVKKNLKDLFPDICHRTRFNRTRRNLHDVIKQIRKKLSEILGYSLDDYRIIDSIPIPVCEFGRAHFHKSFIELVMGIVLLKKKLILVLNYMHLLLLMSILLTLS